MTVSRVWAFGLVLCGLGAGTTGALALDAPHTLHRAKAAERHIIEPHRTGGHHASTRGTAARSATGHANAHTTPAANQPRLTARGAARASARRAALMTTRRHRWHERFTASSFASGDIGAADVTAGEDPVVRQAAIDALGDMNGTAVVIDPSNGRILAMVNQKLALSPGAEPCSTIKLTVAMAALSGGLLTRDTPVKLAASRINMLYALAKSNNLSFEELGRELGFERVHQYANQFGLGELAGYNIDGEQLGTYPDEALPASQGGVGRMCSFGQGVSLTPLQLGAFVSALANGGTLYYLQHPTPPEEASSFEPKIKRTLDSAPYVPELQDGMSGAVEYGTARRLKANFHALPVFGKTGTCSAKGTRFGWFASWADSPQGSLVTVFFLEGGRPTFGPRAAEMTGAFYQNLWDNNWFASKGQQNTASVSTGTSLQDQAQQ